MTATKIFEEDDEFSEGDRWEALAWDVPKSTEFSEGIKYSFQYLGPADEETLWYDNANHAHGVGRHHHHYRGEVEGIEFEGLRSYIQNSSTRSRSSMSKNSPDHAHEPPEDVEYPSTLRITSKQSEDHKESVLDRAERWEQGEEVPHVVNFQDASRLQRILTPRRLDLVRSLMDAPAESMRNLADRLDRDVRQVHDDLQILSEYRIVHFREEGGAKKTHIPYDTVKIEVELSKSIDNTSESPASA